MRLSLKQRILHFLVIFDYIKLNILSFDHVLEWHQIEHVVIYEKDLWGAEAIVRLLDHAPVINASR